MISTLWLKEATRGLSQAPAAPSPNRTVMSSPPAAPPPSCSPPPLTAAPSPYQWCLVRRRRPTPSPRHARPSPPTHPRRPPANCCSSSPTSCWRGARVRSHSWPTALRSRRRTSGFQSQDCYHYLLLLNVHFILLHSSTTSILPTSQKSLRFNSYSGSLW